MSEEEKKAIEKIKKILYMFPESEELKLLLNLIENQQKIIKKQSYTNKKLRRTLKTVRKERNKQQKEIERLEARRYMYNAETGEISQIPLNNNYISKDKIKAKIEDLEKQDKESKLSHNYLIIPVLQSLLEEE